MDSKEILFDVIGNYVFDSRALYVCVKFALTDVTQLKSMFLWLYISLLHSIVS